MLLPKNLELPQKSEIIAIKEADVVNPMAQYRYALNP